MSVGLLIEDGSKTSYVPIATQNVFKNHWLPISHQENFDIIKMFETGMSFQKEEIPSIINELERFDKRMIVYNPNSYKIIRERLELLISTLKNIKDQNVDIFIG